MGVSGTGQWVWALLRSGEGGWGWGKERREKRGNEYWGSAEGLTFSFIDSSTGSDIRDLNGGSNGVSTRGGNGRESQSEGHGESGDGGELHFERC